MFSKLTLAATASALALTIALAQSPPSNPAPSTAPAAQPQSGGGKVNIIARQSPEQFLASKFKGTEVVGADNQKVGGVSDILFERNGKITAYVIGVGGFLGLGAKEIALEPGSVEMVAGENGASTKLRVAMNKDELSKAAAFEPYTPPRPAAPVSQSGRPSPGSGTRIPPTQ